MAAHGVSMTKTNTGHLHSGRSDKANYKKQQTLINEGQRLKETEEGERVKWGRKTKIIPNKRLRL